MYFQHHLIVFTLILIIKKVIGENINQIIRVFETDNNYPRALNLDNGTVIAFSGYKSGKISVYNEYAEEIMSHLQFVEYDSSVDIIQYNRDNLIMGWGKNNYLQIVLFNLGNFNWTSTILNENEFYSTTYKISILPNKKYSEKIFIGWINKGILNISLFAQNDLLFKEDVTIFNGKIDNNFISCIEVFWKKYNGINDYNHILCQYINDSCKIQYIVIDRDSNGIVKYPSLLYQN